MCEKCEKSFAVLLRISASNQSTPTTENQAVKKKSVAAFFVKCGLSSV